MPSRLRSRVFILPLLVLGTMIVVMLLLLRWTQTPAPPIVQTQNTPSGPTNYAGPRIIAPANIPIVTRPYDASTWPAITLAPHTMQRFGVNANANPDFIGDDLDITCYYSNNAVRTHPCPDAGVDGLGDMIEVDVANNTDRAQIVRYADIR